MEFSLRTLKPLIITTMMAGKVAYIEGSPAMGKSAFVKGLANELNLYFLDVRVALKEAYEINGLPNFLKDVNGIARSVYAPFMEFILAGDTIPLRPDGEPYDGVLLFLDEISSSNSSTQSALYRLIHEKELGDGKKLHPDTVIIAAGNKTTDGAIAYDLSTALKSRMINYKAKIDLASWIEWASEVGIDSRITTFAQWDQSYLYKFDPDSDESNYPAPRTWEALSDQLKIIGNKITKANQAEYYPLVAATIGESTANVYLAYHLLRDELPDPMTIINNPTTAAIPDDLQLCWATLAMLANHTDKHFEAISQYVDRMPLDFQFNFYTPILKAKGVHASHKATTAFCLRIAKAKYNLK